MQRVPQFLGGGRIGIQDRPIPEPAEGQLLLRIRANALCGTDRAQLRDGSTATPGHEAAGEVVEVGSGTSTAIGTQGVVFLMDFCGTCRSCREGATNQCLAKRGDMGFTHDGGFGQLELVHESNFFPTGPDIDPAEATLLLDVMGTTSHALGRARAARDDIRSLLVGGAGPIGLGTVAMAHLLWKGVQVVVADLIPYRLALAQRLGAQTIDLGAQGLDSGLRAIGFDLDGADIAIDTSGRDQSRRSLLDALGRRGVLVCVGHGEELTLSVSDDLIIPERTVMGSEYFRYDALPANLALLRGNLDYLGQLITHRFGIGDLQAAYDLFFAGQTGKVVVEQ